MQLAPGLELIGQYEGSGFKEPRFVARRGDGQVVQMPHLVFLVASNLGPDLAEVARKVSDEFGREVSAGNVRYLIENKLIPAGLVVDPAAPAPTLTRSNPLLALRFRARVVPAWVVRALTFIFQPLFFPPVVGAVVAALIGFDIWLFAYHGIGQGVHELFYRPENILLVFGIVVASAVFHEFGHATACRYGGARPGGMGVGLYILWPAFFTDVTDAYRLGRGGRLRTDLGGIYFNAISMLVVAAVYFATGLEAMLIAIVVQHLEVVHQLMPFLRLDGYYIVSDLTGIPDLFARIRPALSSLLPWKRVDPRIAELKRSARTILTIWVLLLIPVIGGMFVMIAVATPALVGTAAASFTELATAIATAVGAGLWVEAAIALLRTAALLLPLAGIALLAWRLMQGLAHGLAHVSGPHVLRRVSTVVAFSSVALLVFSGAMWGTRLPVVAADGSTQPGSIIPRARHSAEPDSDELAAADAQPVTSTEPVALHSPQDPIVVTSTTESSKSTRSKEASARPTAPDEPSSEPSPSPTRDSSPSTEPSSSPDPTESSDPSPKPSPSPSES